MSNQAEFKPHPLHRSWKYFLHYPLYTSSTEAYGSAAYTDVFQFNTVEDFWAAYSRVPSPSTVFANEKRPRNKLGGRIVEGFGIFQDGIIPEWEKTPGGCHLELGGITDATLLDRMWEALCLTLVGETMCSEPPEVVGVRVVDKTKARRPMYRMEVWLSRQHEEVKSKVLENIKGAFLQDGHECDLPCAWKEHPRT